MRVNARRLEQIYGESGLIFLSIEDITQKIQADSERFEHIRLLNQMCEIAKIGAWEFNTDNFEGNWTSQVARIHDLNPDQDDSMAFSLGLYTEQSKEIIENAIDRSIREGEPFDLELELISVAGKRKWVRIIGTPVKRDGRVVQVGGTVQDISDRKKMELAFLESQEKFEKIFNASGALMAICTLAEGRFIDVNPSFSQVMGHTREQVIGKTPKELKIFIDSNERPRLNKAALREGRARTLMCTVNARDGSPRNLVLSVNRLVINGVPHCFVVANLISQP
jgi:PAS domain S-box-containing protein